MKMNRLGILSVAACFFAGSIFTGCNKDDDAPGNSSFTSINAKVENGPWDFDEVKAVMDVDEYIAGKSNYTGGGFNIQLSATVDEKYLYPIGDDMPEGITVSDKTAMIGSAYIEAYKSGAYKGDISYIKLPEMPDGSSTSFTLSAAQALIVYVDKNVTMKGTFKDPEDIDLIGLKDLFDDFKVTATANAGFKKGWNYMYVTNNFSIKINLVTGKTSANGTISLTTQNPGGMKWYFDGDDVLQQFGVVAAKSFQPETDTQLSQIAQISKEFQKAVFKFNPFLKSK